MQANDCYLSDEHKYMLREIASRLKTGGMNHIYDVRQKGRVPLDLVDIFGNAISYAILKAFAMCNYLTITENETTYENEYSGYDEAGHHVIYEFNVAKILKDADVGFQDLEVIEVNSKTKVEAMNQSITYKGLSEDHWNFLVLMAKAIRGKYIKNPSTASKGFYILPVIENGKILEFKNFQEIFLQAHQNDLEISLKAFLDLATLGYFEKAKNGNYYLIEAKILPAVADYEAQENGDTASNSTPLQAEFQCDIFMVMPFREGLDEVYHNLIVPTVRELFLSIRRGDERQKASANIVGEVFAYIKNAKIILVDCTEIDGKPNGNVYYELGYADALEKDNVILISQTNATTLPFDIKHRGVIEYKDNAKGNVKLREDLRKAIQSILGDKD